MNIMNDIISAFIKCLSVFSMQRKNLLLVNYDFLVNLFDIIS